MDSSASAAPRRAAVAWTVAGLLLVAVTGWVDFASGYELSVALFYLLPIALATLRAGPAAGMAVAGAAGAAWLAADRALGHEYPSPWYPYWNTGIRLGMFLTVAWTLGALRAALERERRQRADLEEANRVKDEFLGMAAHDLRTPIAVVQIYADMLLEGRGAPLAPRQRELLEVIRRKSRFMLSLVNDLLDLARIESGRLVLVAAPGDYRAFLAEKLLLLEAIGAQRDVGIRVEIEPGLPWPVFDRDRMEQVVDNLVFNGLKFSPPGGTLTVRARLVGDGVETRVTDEGPGIPAGQAEAVFRAFHKAHEESPGGEKGTGLGLAIAKRVIEAHGGRIWIEHPATGGTSLVFTLPAAPRGADDEARPGPQASREAPQLVEGR